MVGKTWLAKGILNGKMLTIDSCCPISRKKLTQTMLEVDCPAIVAMDFPFGLPWDVAKEWHPNCDSMIDLWEKATTGCFDNLARLVEKDSFKPGNEPLRVGDTYFPNCYSPVRHKTRNKDGRLTITRTPMLPMTFHGMKVLGKLWNSEMFNVPPLRERDGKATLLEVMPGAVVKSWNLTNKGYKGGREWWVGRAEILNELSKCSEVNVTVHPEVRGMCLGNDDALDSVVATFAAGLWRMDRSLFREPAKQALEKTNHNKARFKRVSIQAREITELDAAKLEGWLYAPERQ